MSGGWILVETDHLICQMPEPSGLPLDRKQIHKMHGESVNHAIVDHNFQ